MIKSLLFLSALLGVQTMPVHTDDQYVGQQERQYQHTEDIGGNTEVTYKYESNEVTSLSDLVDGNIYEVNFDMQTFNDLTSGRFLTCGNLLILYLSTDVENNYYSYHEMYLSKSSSGLIYVGGIDYDLTHTAQTVFSYSLNPSLYFTSIKFIFMKTSNFSINNDLVSYISYTSYNEVLDVTYNAPSSLFGLMADFFDQYIYSGIPHINDINYEVNGQTITMKDWLVVSTTIAVVILFLFILFFIFRWLIRTFSNAFLWR